MRFVLSLFVGLAGFYLWMTPVMAQPAYTMPSYSVVEGVGADDVLNIRAAPDANAEIVGSLAHNAGPVEVVREDDGWAYVSAGERMGWASAAYLRPVQLSLLGQSAIPDGLVCSGTEPFWGVSISSGGISFARIDMGEESFNLIATDGFSGVGPSKNLVVGGNDTQHLTAVISDEICSDGMSDRDYARRIDLVMNGADGPIGYSGCCAMPLN